MNHIKVTNTNFPATNTAMGFTVFHWTYAPWEVRSRSIRKRFTTFRDAIQCADALAQTVEHTLVSALDQASKRGVQR